MILVCGATGMVGGRVAASLVMRGANVRAFVRPATEAVNLAAGIDVARGDLRDPESIRGALEGVVTVVSTASAFSRLRQGASDIDIAGVDEIGHRNLIEAAERAGVRRFVFLSLAERLKGVATPLTEAKAAIERRLAGSPIRTVIVHSDLYQETSLSPAGRFDWAKRAVLIPGNGRTPTAYVSVVDVAELLTTLATEMDPPGVVEVGGPEHLSRRQAAEILAEVAGSRVRQRSVPRLVLRAVRALAARRDPALASEFGLVLASDLYPTTSTDSALRQRGIRPTTVRSYLEAVTGAGQPADAAFGV